ncbi:preprotein translocase subunit SecE [Aerococcus urinaeequi]|uniref:preprotein translocase subunit SecE n=1 Tax=Aerococcus TaxID=1375 RepID=UPI000845FD8C|nr:preprotein translocase subunit SecE [Aerococcus urinaeequi]
MQFLKDVWHEMRLTTWPSGGELVRYTGIVLSTIIIVAIFLGIIDTLAQWAFAWFINL